ncbi:MAG: 16S rRNA (guanine(966)-N(2))-methyltransferase RsmD [Clostridia bacterium]|nr:16S rRNA (guanine(966)-N(2))-methyltransferase RsmD [Clostridia bacterium]
MMRIITGKARGVRLATLEGETTRPTAERTKEAIFSMLQFELQEARVLDLFAGSGQLALEALSRGAAQAVLCDASKNAIRIIRTNAEKTRLLPQCEIICTDYRTLLMQRLRGCAPFDLVFLDPPYAQKLVPSALDLLYSGGYLHKDSKIICETADARDALGGAKQEHLFEVLRVSHYGAACVTILKPKGAVYESCDCSGQL